MPAHIIVRGKARVCLFAVLAITLCLTDALLAQPSLQSPVYPTPIADASVSDPLIRLSAKRSNLRIVERFVKVVELANKIVRVEGFDPEVIDPVALSPTQERVQALSPGNGCIGLVSKGQTYRALLLGVEAKVVLVGKYQQ